MIGIGAAHERAQSELSRRRSGLHQSRRSEAELTKRSRIAEQSKLSSAEARQNRLGRTGDR